MGYIAWIHVDERSNQGSSGNQLGGNGRLQVQSILKIKKIKIKEEEEEEELSFVT